MLLLEIKQKHLHPPQYSWRLGLTVVGDGLDVEDGLLSEPAEEERERFVVRSF